MKVIKFLIWLRDELKCCPQSKEGNKIGLPTNGELKRWLKNGSVKVNNKIINTESEVEFPVTNLIFFPKNDKSRTTIL